jgi:pyruvoyl-dependent arginine decarboxylase (PvlArgDC)
MNVRVRPGHCVATVLARSARERFRTGTEQALPEPQGEALFPDAGWAVEEKRARERVATDGVVESRAEGVVAVNGKQRHPNKVRAASPSEQCQKRHAS